MSDATTTQDPATQLLIEALARISPEGAWTQHAFARKFPGGPATQTFSPKATCWCSLGACRALEPPRGTVPFDWHRTAAQAEARLSAWTWANHACSVTEFNDNLVRTQAEVFTMFKAAIAAGPLPYQTDQKENQA